MRKLIRARGKEVEIDVDIILEMSIISLRRLIDGGAAILAIEAKNQRVVIAGKRRAIPFVRVRLREVVDS